MTPRELLACWIALWIVLLVAACAGADRVNRLFARVRARAADARTTRRGGDR